MNKTTKFIALMELICLLGNTQIYAVIPWEVHWRDGESWGCGILDRAVGDGLSDEDAGAEP